MKKNVHAQKLGQLGGVARAKVLTQAQRLAISRLANAAKAAKKGDQRDEHKGSAGA